MKNKDKTGLRLVQGQEVCAKLKLTEEGLRPADEETSKEEYEDIEEFCSDCKCGDCAFAWSECGTCPVCSSLEPEKRDPSLKKLECDNFKEAGLYDK